MKEYLQSTYFMDFENPAVRKFADSNSNADLTAKENAVKLYYAVRDGFRYDPYRLDLRKEGMKASNLVSRTSGYCIEKAVLLGAVARSVGIPSRLSFYIVQNHIATERIEMVLGTNKLVFHGAAELLLDQKWLKVTPAFDSKLCTRLGVAPLEFDGSNDAVFQQYDENGNVFMEYLHDYGNFAEFPYELAISELRKHYPDVFQNTKYSSEELIYNLAV